MRATLAVLAVLAAASCATQFNGSAFVPGGPQGCAATCEQRNMVMTAFIFSGEFATSCVCGPKPLPQPAAPSANSAAVTADVSPLVGVILARRDHHSHAHH
jgi:hypothetical protein